MQNDAGEFVDMYIPRKCSMTNRLIGSSDYAAVQFNVGHVSEDGCATHASLVRQLRELAFSRRSFVRNATGCVRLRGFARARVPVSGVWWGCGAAPRLLSWVYRPRPAAAAVGAGPPMSPLTRERRCSLLREVAVSAR